MKRSAVPLVLLVLVVVAGVAAGLYWIKARSALESGPWREWAYVETRDRILIMEGKPVSIVPSQCELRATVLGPRNNTLFKEEFGGGWRIDVTGGKRSLHTEAGEGLIELQSRPFINGRFIYRQYYRMVGDRLALIRLEDDQGKSASNSYVYPNHTIGPRIPIREPAEWEQSLGSGDPGEVLWALVWLGGSHATPTPGSQNIAREAQEDAEHFLAVWNNPAIQQKIAQLKNSANPWVAEAARAVQFAEK